MNMPVVDTKISTKYLNVFSIFQDNWVDSRTRPSPVRRSSSVPQNTDVTVQSQSKYSFIFNITFVKYISYNILI